MNCTEPESVQLLETAGVIGLIALLFVIIAIIIWRV
jgi:hypothetical protein